MADKIRKNTILSILISLIQYIYPAISFAYVARVLQPEGLGKVQYASAFSSYFVMITGLGMPIYGLRSTSTRKRSDLPALAGELFLMRCIFGGIACAIFLAFQPFARNADTKLLFIFGVNILSAIPACDWLYKGLQEYSILAAISAISRILGIALLLLFVRNASAVYAFALISVAMELVVSISQALIANAKWNLSIVTNCFQTIRQRRSFSTLRQHLPSMMLFFLMSCAVTIYSHTDVVMLGAIRGSSEAGIYSCAAKIKMVLPTITGALWAAALPRAATLWKRGNIEHFQALTERSYHAVQTIVIPLVLYFFIFAGPCVRLLGGSAYSRAALPMRLLILAVIPIGISNIAGGQVLIPTGREIQLFRAELAGALSNILLNAMLIPLMSVSGAAIATTFSEALVALLTVRSVRCFVRVKVIDPCTMKRVALSCLTASASALLLLIDAPDICILFISLTGFSVIYGVTMVVLKDPFFLDLFRTVKQFYRRFVPEAIRIRIGMVRRKMRSRIYKAWAGLCGKDFHYYCPCCDTRIRKFKSGEFADRPEIYNPKRYTQCDQEVICPVCGALPRHRILAAWCDSHRDDIKGRVLYFALESGMAQWFKRNGIELQSADLYQPADLRLDIQNTGEPTESYDWIFCNHVLEHIPDYRKALTELHRILKPGGHLICSFPIDESWEKTEENICADEAERLSRFGQVDHLRVFGRDGEEILRNAGFSVERIEGDTMDDTILPVPGPADYDMNYLFLCTKIPFLQ